MRTGKSILAISILAAAAILLSNCSWISDDTKWDYHPMYPGEIANIESGGTPGQITFVIESFFSSGCDQFSHAEYIRENHSYYVRFFQKRPIGVACTDAVVDTQISWRITRLSQGENIFRFWRSDSTSLDTIIIIQ